MRRYSSFLLPLLVLPLFVLHACSEAEYTTRTLSKLKLSLELDSESKVLVNTNREAIIDTEGIVVQITRLDRMRNDDESIGKLVLSTAKEEGLALASLKVARLDARGISGVCVEGDKGNNAILIGGFVGLLSVDGYLCTLRFPKGSEENAERVLQSISYLRK